MGLSVGAEVLHRLRPVGSSTRPWPGLLLHGWIGEPPDRIVVLLRPYRSLVCQYRPVRPYRSLVCQYRPATSVPFVSLFQTGLRMPCLWIGSSEGSEDPIHHQGLPAAFHAISDQSRSLREGNAELTQHS